MRAALVLILFGALLCGCGQKGPLFIPNDDGPPAPSASADTAPQPQS